MQNKRGALGLPIEMLVVIIISLVVLAGGIVILYKFIYGAESIKIQLDEQTNTELDRLLTDQGKLVALPRYVADIARGENHVFGIGILNVDARQTNDTFRIEASISKATDENGEAIVVEDEVNKWILYNPNIIRLAEGQHTKESIMVAVPNDAIKGQYIFNVKVYSRGAYYASGDESDIPDTLYGNPQKFIVNVK